METRNRCKACRFKRCVEQGMAMESVKMGRIPKKVKERALRDYQKYQEKISQQEMEDNNDAVLFTAAAVDDDDEDDDEINDLETDNFDLFSMKRESISSTSSYSSSSNSSMNNRQSVDSNHDIVVVPLGKKIIFREEKKKDLNI